MVRKEKWSDDRVEFSYPTINPDENDSTFGEHFGRTPEPPIRNAVIDTIVNRRSIREFKPDPIPDDVLWTILECARWAATGDGLQPWRILVVKDPEKRRKLFEYGLLARRRELTKFQGLNPMLIQWGSTSPDRYTHLSEERKQKLTKSLARPQSGMKKGTSRMSKAWKAPVALVVFGQCFTAADMDWDMGGVMQNLMISAISLGLGTVWHMTPTDPRRSKNDALRQIYNMLEVPLDYRLFGVLWMGYPDQEPKPRPRFYTQDFVFFDKWGNWGEMPHPEQPKRMLDFPAYARY